MLKRFLTLCFLLAASDVVAQEMVTLPTRPSVTQSYFLTSAPKNTAAVALLFPGSGGSINLRKEGGQVKFSPGNFLVRVRTEFIKRGVRAVIIDAPSDQQRGSGMSDEFRLGDQHLVDMEAVMTDIATRLPNTPIFLIGTSRGTVSAAALGARTKQPIAGVVLTSSLFRAAGRGSKEQGPGLSKFDFATIHVPLLFVHHVSDQCNFTPYSDAAQLSGKYPLISVYGGDTPQSGPCDPFSQHGYFGKEAETIEQIVNWMLKRPFEHEVK